MSSFDPNFLDEMRIRHLLRDDKEFALREEKRKKFHQELRKSFPLLWRNGEREGVPSSLATSQEHDYYAMPSTDPGWNELIWETSKQLNELIEQITGIFPISKLPFASQVKEKFGVLRFYCDGHWDEYPNDFDKSFHGVIAAAEQKSTLICENCSKPGAVRHHSPYTPEEKLSLIKCRCDFCWINDALETAKFALQSKRTKNGDKDYYSKRVEKLANMLEVLKE